MSNILSSSKISIETDNTANIIAKIRDKFNQNVNVIVIITSKINGKNVKYTFVNITSNLKCQDHDSKIKEILELEGLDVKYYTKTATRNFNKYIAKKQVTTISSTKPIETVKQKPMKFKSISVFDIMSNHILQYCSDHNEP